MSGTCPAIAEGAFLSSVLDYIDCQARTLGAFGFDALTGPGALVPAALTIILTIFVAMFGIRMLLGSTPQPRELVFSALKVGIVAALALSWGAYRALIYDVALLAPADLSARISGPYSPASASSDLISQIQQVDYAFLELGRLGTGPQQLSSTIDTDTASGQAQVNVVQASEPPHIFESFSLGTARLAFLVGTIASLGAVRLIAGLLLAIGPLFVLLLLFENTRSLLEGWIRGLLAATIAAFAVTMVLAIEISLLSPWLAEILALRRAGYPVGGSATELLVVTFAFALILVAGLAMGSRVAVAFRFGRPSIPANHEAPLRQHELLVASPGPLQRVSPAQVGGARSRAAATSEALAAMERREVFASAGAAAVAPLPSSGSSLQSGRSAIAVTPQSRRTRHRVSASAARRDASR